MTFFGFGELLALGFLPVAAPWLSCQHLSWQAKSKQCHPDKTFEALAGELSRGTGKLCTNHAHISDSWLAAAGEGVDEGLPRVGVPSELELVKAASRALAAFVEFCGFFRLGIIEFVADMIEHFRA